MWIVRNLGLVGLYKGASACLLRDGMYCFLGCLAAVTNESTSSVLGHLLPYLQPSEEGLLRGEPTEIAGCSANVDCWCHRGYACGLLHHTVRCYQDQVTGGGT